MRFLLLCVVVTFSVGTFAGEVELTEDLYCPDPEDPPTPNANTCAITLDGEDAVLDCNQYMVDGDSSEGNGICILNGASAINCHVQKFGVGIDVDNGGIVNDCEVMFNHGTGIYVRPELFSAPKIKISNTYIHDNASSGIYSYGAGDSSEISIEIDNVKSNNNGEDGMAFKALSNAKLEVQIKDSETSKNGERGIYIAGGFEAIDLELEGIISRYNGDGIDIDALATEGEVKVKGDVNLYDNEENGFIVSSANVKVVVEKRGALNSCGHPNKDIRSVGAGVATFSGNGYTCDSTSPNLSDIITCNNCPTCTQPQ